MFKILTLGILLYALYRLFFGPPLLDTPEIKKGSKQSLNPDEDGEYVDYEEVD
jgi:hypothetical protein